MDYLQNQICLTQSLPALPRAVTNLTVIKLYGEGIGVKSFFISAESAPNACLSNPAFMSQWYLTLSLNLGSPLPLTFYTFMVQYMAAFEPLVGQIKYTYMLGTLPAPIKFKKRAYRYGGVNNSNYITKVLNAFPQSGESGGADQQAGIPVGIQAVSATLLFVSQNAVPVWSGFNKRVILDVQVVNATAGTSTLSTQAFNLMDDLIETPYNLAGYLQCFLEDCPKRVTLLDPVTRAVVGTLVTGINSTTVNGSTNATIGFFPFNATESGHGTILFDVPQKLFAFGSADRDDTVCAIYENVDPSTNANGIYANNSLDGPYFQRPTMSFANYLATTGGGEFDPDKAQASVGEFLTHFTITKGVQGYDIACDPIGRKAVNGLCNLLDNFEMEVAGIGTSAPKLLFHPRPQSNYQLISVLNISFDMLNIVPIPAILSPSSAAARQLKGCPEQLEVNNREADFATILLTYMNAPPSNLTVVISGSGCQLNNNTLGALLVELDTSSFTRLSTQQVVFPACQGQLIAVTMSPTGETCLLWEANPALLSLSDLGDVMLQAQAIALDAQSELIFDIANELSFAASLVRQITEETIPLLFSNTSNTSSLDSQNDKLAALQAALAALETQIQQNLLAVNSFSAQLLSQLEADKQLVQDSLLNATEEARVFALIQSEIDQIVQLVNQIRALLIPFEQYNTKAALYAHTLAGLNLFVAGAPASFNFSDLGIMAIIFGNITCPATIDAATQDALRQAQERIHCTDSYNFLCPLSGELIGLRWFVLSGFFILFMVPFLYLTISLGYGLICCPRNKQFLKALYCGCKNHATSPMNSLRPVIVMSILTMFHVLFVAIFSP